MKPFWVHDHVNIGRIDGNQQSDQSPASRPAQRGNQKSNAPGHFTHTADEDERLGRGKRWRYDLHIKLWLDEMADARNYKKNCRQPAQGGSHKFNTISGFISKMFDQTLAGYAPFEIQVVFA